MSTRRSQPTTANQTPNQALKQALEQVLDHRDILRCNT